MRRIANPALGVGALLLAGVLAAPQTMESPQQHLGHAVGADRKLADWGQIVEYFQKLAAASPRVDLQTLGRTTEDKPFIMAVISAPDNLANLEKYRRIQELLADPRKIEGSAERLLEEGKTVVLITCGIHSTEVASPQTSMEFAWEMAAAQDEETLQILENVIFLFVPSLNPDGVDIVVDWYRKTVGTPAEGRSPPELYHVYVGHDNNRDWFMFTQQETRMAVGQIHNRWHPQIVYDVHQMGPYGARIFVPPFIDPVDPNVDPILQAQIVDLGGWMFSRLIGAGKKGVVTNAIYDAYTPARAYQHYHGGVRILSESASARLATPIQIDREDLRPGRNYDARTASWNFPDPWTGGSWRVRDIVEDQKIALKACLLHAARNRENWLRNFLQVGRNALGRQTPFAFVLPPPLRQRDPQAFYDLLQTLDFGQVELHRAASPFEVEGAVNVAGPRGQKDRREFPAGSIIVYLKQPYGPFAKTMLEIQNYPELRQYPGGPLKRPYDVTAHTLGIQLGVEAYQIDDPFDVASERASAAIPSGRVQGEGDYWLFSHRNNAFAKLANRLLKGEHSLHWAPNGFQAEGEGFPVGTLMAQPANADVDLKSLIQDLPVTIRQVKKWPQLAWRRIRLPRIGLYKGWRPAMDEGWTRWILERHEFPYHTLSDREIRESDLSEYDVVLVADQSPQALLKGLGEDYPEEYRGGMGEKGLGQLRAFVESGGAAVFLGASTQLPVDHWDMGVQEVLGELSNQEFYIPGSLLLAEVNDRHPIGYGMGEEAALMFVRGQAFAWRPEKAVSVVQFPPRDLLLSGWADGADRLHGKSALVEVPLGKGKVILIGFRTQFRAQARGTYKFLFNSLYYSTVR